MNKNKQILLIHRGWEKIVLFFLSALVFSAFTGSIIESIFSLFVSLNRNESEIIFVFGQTLGTVAVIFIFLTQIEKRDTRFIGLKKTSFLKIFYTFISTCLFVFLPFISLNIANSIELIDFQFSFYKITLVVILYFFVAINEELFFRGYLLPSLLNILSAKYCVIIVSVLFSAIHLLNSDISHIGLFNIFLFSLILSIIFLKTRNIILVITIHFGWNIAQSMMGFNVSGSKTDSIFILNFLGKESLTGGGFGLEGSIILTFFLMFANILFGYFYYWNLSHEKK